MVRLDYIEQTGHGVPLIVSKYGKEVFDITENFITVTIPLNKDKALEKDLQLAKEDGLDEYDQKMLNLMKEKREKGIIERAGSKKKGQWVKLKKKLYGFPNLHFIAATHSPLVESSIGSAVVYDPEKNIQVENLAELGNSDKSSCVSKIFYI